jgi:tRNA(Ile)-lysidine synthase
VGHLNHGLRGRSSDADERLVRNAAAMLNLPILVERADVRKAARNSGVSLEMAARQIRHQFLAKAAMKLRIRTVAFAHHAYDQVELFFLRLLRGSGGEGLAGMRWSNPSPADAKVGLIRPLLEQSKATLLEFAAAKKIRFREDSTNASLDIQRNRIRHELLPFIMRRNQPAIARAVLRVMDIIGAEADMVTQSAEAWLHHNTAAASSGESRKASGSGADSSCMPDAIKQRPLDQLPVALQRRCLQLQLLRAGLAPTYDLIEQLRKTPNRSVSVGTQECVRWESDGEKPVGDGFRNDPGADRASLQVFRDHRGLIHIRSSDRANFVEALTEIQSVTRRGQTTFEEVTFQWKAQSIGRLKNIEKLPGKEIFDADKVGSPIFLRHWRRGDRFRPIGMRHAVRLQDFFTNRKIPRPRRHELILATTSAGEVFWVEGERISENYKVTERTTRLLHWQWQRV